MKVFVTTVVNVIKIVRTECLSSSQQSRVIRMNSHVWLTLISFIGSNICEKLIWSDEFDVWAGVGLHVGLLQICSDIRKIFAVDPIHRNK